MHYRRICFYLFVILLVIIANRPGKAQDSTGQAYQSKITISAEVDKKEVPLNREVTCLVMVEWTGDLRRYQISDVENPMVNNFDIIRTSAADQRLSEAGVEKAARIYEFVLQPRSLGMGYIENVIVNYIDTVTGDGASLIAPRLDVKVIDPVPEPGSKTWLIKWLLLAVALIATLVVLLSWRKRVEERKRKEAEAVKVVALEEEYLTQLRESVDLKSPELKINEAFSLLSKIARKYLSQKYNIPALESTTENILSELANFNLDPALISNFEEILTVSDLAKFAGSEGKRNELDRTYTLLEAVLERNLGETRAEEQTGND